MKFDIWDFLRKSVEKIEVLLKSVKNNWYTRPSTHTHTQTRICNTYCFSTATAVSLYVAVHCLSFFNDCTFWKEGLRYWLDSCIIWVGFPAEARRIFSKWLKLISGSTQPSGSASWKPKGLSRTVAGKLYLYLYTAFCFIPAGRCCGPGYRSPVILKLGFAESWGSAEHCLGFWGK